jgi:hypothetical protein
VRLAPPPPPPPPPPLAVDLGGGGVRVECCCGGGGGGEDVGGEVLEAIGGEAILGGGEEGGGEEVEVEDMKLKRPAHERSGGSGGVVRPDAPAPPALPAPPAAPAAGTAAGGTLAGLAACIGAVHLGCGMGISALAGRVSLANAAVGLTSLAGERKPLTEVRVPLSHAVSAAVRGVRSDLEGERTSAGGALLTPRLGARSEAARRLGGRALLVEEPLEEPAA